MLDDILVFNLTLFIVTCYKVFTNGNDGKIYLIRMLIHKKRIQILTGIILALLLILIVRLGYIQIIEGSKYSGISEKRQIKRTALKALRGKVFDSNGVVLATNKHSFNISAKYKDLLYIYLRNKNKLLPRLIEIKAHENSDKSCIECHSEQENLMKRLIDVADINEKDLFDIAERTVKKVEKIKEEVNERVGRKVRIVEEVGLHLVSEDIPFETIAKIESQKSNFPDIFIEIKPYRWYPGQRLASHLIGYINKIKKEEWQDYNFKWNCRDNLPFISDSQILAPEDKKTGSFCDEIDSKKSNTDRLFSLGYSGNILVGKTGVEAYYNMALAGNPGERFVEVRYKNAKPDKKIIERPANSGEDIYLTIDSNIQYLAEKALGNRRGAVVVMNPWNGEIIAMASNPRFNPNTFNKDYGKIIKDRRKPLLNRPIQSALPPGSTFKIVTAIAALSEGAISGENLFRCNGRNASTRNKFRCFSRYGHGHLNIIDALQYSCNEFFFETAKKLGGDLLHKWGAIFGFGQPSGIDIPYERKGLWPKPKSVSDTMNISIGQGALLATPLQVTTMIAVIANGGYSVQPHILRNITKYSGKVIVEPDIKANKLDLPDNVLETVKQGLVRVVTNGTGKRMGIGKYLVAGKTGTAETRKSNENHAWFTGFAPHDNPQYCFSVLIEYTSKHASEATAPVLRKLLSGIFSKES